MQAYLRALLNELVRAVHVCHQSERDQDGDGLSADGDPDTSLFGREASVRAKWSRAESQLELPKAERIQGELTR
jgi:hypothetical protein